jgi:NhaA family Na+:H+ antiporter
VNLFVLPMFALANAGVRITGAAWSGQTALLVIVGLLVSRVVGKTRGVIGGCLLVQRFGPYRFPTGVPGRALVGVAVAAGAPFTVSLFVASAAFADAPDLLAAARVGVLTSAVVCAGVAAVVLRRDRSPAAPPP